MVDVLSVCHQKYVLIAYPVTHINGENTASSVTSSCLQVLLCYWMATQKWSGDRGIAGHMLIERLQSLSDSVGGCLACPGWKIEHQSVIMIPDGLTLMSCLKSVFLD